MKNNKQKHPFVWVTTKKEFNEWMKAKKWDKATREYHKKRFVGAIVFDHAGFQHVNIDKP